MGFVILGPGDLQPAPGAPGEYVTPSNPDGDPYPYCMVLPDGYDLAYADRMEDLLEVLLPGYLAEPDLSVRAERRILLAASAAAAKQAEILAALDPDSISDEEWKYLAAPRTGPGSPNPTMWASDIPLIVVETSYAPFTDRPRPASASDGVQSANLQWVRPAEEEDFLLSLHEIGFVRVMISTD